MFSRTHLLQKSKVVFAAALFIISDSFANFHDGQLASPTDLSIEFTAKGKPWDPGKNAIWVKDIDRLNAALEYIYSLDDRDCSLQQINNMFLLLLNSYRNEHGLKPVEQDKTLTVLAQQYSEYMTEHGVKHSQNLIDPSLKLSFAILGENLASTNFNPVKGGGNSFVYTLALWMLSNSHEANLTNRQISDVGLGVVRANGKTFYVLRTAIDTAGVNSHDSAFADQDLVDLSGEDLVNAVVSVSDEIRSAQPILKGLCLSFGPDS
jgi:uncharacterized protein YkwD